MTLTSSKNFAVAIGFNLLLPGLGYVYLGRWLVGIAGGTLVIAICLRSPPERLLSVWIVLNVIMLIDMCLLGSKMRAKD